MKIIPLIMLTLILVACNRFNRDHFISSSFGVDLESISSGKTTEYTDGLFLVYNVEDTDSVYLDYFSQPFNQGDVVLTFKTAEFSSHEVGIIRYRHLDSFDGYTKTVFYIPNRKLLGFGYSDGLL